ncbi:MAG: hypothetical protein RJA49_621 [Actinomycetota bacterium]
MSKLRTTLVVFVASVLAVLSQPIVAGAAEDPVPAFIAPNATWLTVVNYYRSMAGLSRVTEDTTLSPGAFNHSCYMLYNGISHDEIPGKPGYTASGDTAGNQGNVAVSSGTNASVRDQIELWMTGPFHAIGILRPGLRSVGFGQCKLPNTPTWHTAATLDVFGGMDWNAPRPAAPVVWPGNGTTTSLNHFIAETPNPVTYCGWTGGAGLPVIAMMPTTFSNVVSTSITGPTGRLQTCALWSGNTDGAAKSILGGDNAVTVLPRAALADGRYTVNVTTNTGAVTWSFTVSQAAATGVMPVPRVSPVAGPTAYTTMTPFRLADSRTKFRITKLLANVPKRIQVAGIAGIPGDATALSANFTAVNEPATGYLTVYNCTSSRPTASTLNYYAHEVTANAGLFPLGSRGELCLYSPRTIDLVIDVTGYFRPSSVLRYEGMEARPLVSTAMKLNSPGRLRAGQTIVVDVPKAKVGVPIGSKAVAVNITGIRPDQNAYITAYPCGVARPTVSNVNPTVNTTKQNFAIVPLSAAGTMCIYVLKGMHVKVDVLGYFGPSGPHTMVPSSPTRVVDTRDVTRTQMNLGTRGNALPAYAIKTLQLAGQRGIPSTASVISLNVAAVTPTGTGSLTMWDCSSQPPIQTLNFRVGRTVATGVQVQLSKTGTLCIRSTVKTHLIIDVTGWWN